MASHQRRVGVLGTGWGARVSVPAFRAAGWEVAGLWSRRPERAAAEASRLEIPFATDDWQALIQRPEIEAVAIHTPPHMHLELCRAAFAAGKHVLCDKPFATNTADARELLAAAGTSDCTAMINYEFRFAPLRLLIASLLSEGAIGAVRHVSMDLHTTNPLLQMDRAWRLDPSHGGGLLNELGSHAIDRLRQWVGELETVSARLGSYPPPDLDPAFTSEDQVSATFTFAGGGVATLALSWVSDPPAGLRIVVTGSEGVIVATSPGSMLTEGEVLLGRAGEDGFSRVDVASEDAAGGGAVEASARLIRAFEQGIDEGRSPSPNFEDGWWSQIALEGVRESAATGQVVELSRG